MTTPPTDTNAHIHRLDGRTGQSEAMRFFNATRSPSDDGELATLRQLFLQFCVAFALIGVVAFMLGNDEQRWDPAISVGLIVIVGLASLLGDRFVARRLDCTSDGSLVDSYRTRFFLRVAIAEIPALAAFGLSVGAAPWWVYFVGLPFSAFSLVRLAPTARNVERDEQLLRARGCHRPLGQLLGVEQPGLIS